MVWNKTKFRNMHTKDFEAEKVITNIQIEINRTDLTDFLQKKRKRKLILRLPSMWKAFFQNDKSRMDWNSLGDRNANFFTLMQKSEEKLNSFLL